MYFTRADWNAKPPLSTASWGTGRPDYLIAHWVGGYIRPDLDSYLPLVRSLQNLAFNEGYSDIEYNLFVTPTGDIIEGRGWGARSGANGSTVWNDRGLSVCYLAGRTADSTKITPLTEPARRAFRWVFAEARRHGLPLQAALGHQAVRPSYTECPGDQLRDWLPNIYHEPTPTPEPPEVDDMAVRFIKSNRPELDPNEYVTNGLWKRKVAPVGRYELTRIGLTDDSTVYEVAHTTVKSILTIKAEQDV